MHLPSTCFRHETSRHVTCVWCRDVTRVATSVSCWSCVSLRACSIMADDEEAVVLACTSLVFLCSGFASMSGTSEVIMFTPVHAVATPLNTCRSSRACRVTSVFAPCCPTSATQHLHDFFLCQSAWAKNRVVSFRD